MAGQQYQDGQIADGPNGPMIYRASQGWVPIAGAGQAVPSNPLKVREAQGSIAHTAAATQKEHIDAAKTAAALPYEAPKAAAEARHAEFQAQGLSPEVRKTAIEQWQSAQMLDKEIADIKARYAEGPGTTKWLSGIADYNPFDVTNSRFDTAGNAVRGSIAKALGFTGGQLNTPTEMRLNLGSYIPQASDRDQVILDKIGQLENIRDNARRQAISTLGGIPDANGNIAPANPQQLAQLFAPAGQGNDKAPPIASAAPGNPSAPGGPASGPGGMPPAGPSGGSPYGGPGGITNQGQAVSDPALAGVNAQVSGMIQAGRSGDEIRAYLNSVQPGLGDKANNLDANIAYHRQHPGYRVPVNVDQIWQPSSPVQQAVGQALLTRPGAALTGAADLTGGLDELASGVSHLIGDPHSADYYDALKHGVRDAHPFMYGAGQFAGNVASGVGAARALPGLAQAATATLPRVMGMGALAGSVNGALEDNRNRVSGAAIGGAFGAAGAPLGAALGRASEVLMRSRAGQQLENAFRNRGLSQIPEPQAFTPGDKALIRVNPDLSQTTANLRDAGNLGLPYALADASPELRNLGGTVSRVSPDAYALAERTFAPRALGQADRAVQAIDQHLAPRVDVTQRGEDIMRQGSNEYGPLYDQAYQAPVISSPELDSLLATPAGRGATARANTIAANERRDPRAMGFVQDENGQIVLNPFPADHYAATQTARNALNDAQAAYRSAMATPGGNVDAARNAMMRARDSLRQAESNLASAPVAGDAAQRAGYTTQSLDYTKRGMDDLLEPYRNPITGRLQLDESGRAINGVKNDLLSEMDRLNPDYAAARESYGKYAGRRQALSTGFDTLPQTTTTQDSFNRIIGRMSPDQLPEAQSGFATALGDTVAKARGTSNPYQAIYGSPLQQQKVATLFPEGAANFDRLYNLEGDMAKTATETLGGSQTARRQAADEALGGNLLGHATNAAVDTALTGAPIRGLLDMARSYAKDRARLGFGKAAQQKAFDLAGTLFDTNAPADMAALVEQLAKRQQLARQRASAYQRGGSLIGSGAGLLAAPLVAGN